MTHFNQFDWAVFYKEFAGKLRAYKNNREELIAKVCKIYDLAGINMLTLERDNKIVDIDPFTIFGLFNKSKMRDDNREKILTAIAQLFDVSAPIPKSFFVPVLNNQNATFYSEMVCWFCCCPTYLPVHHPATGGSTTRRFYPTDLFFY